ncbi:MAG: hypothetical protein ACLR6B_08585 [Blautia sp.]
MEDRESIGKNARLLFALVFLIGISALSFVFLSGSIPDQYLVAERAIERTDPSSFGGGRNFWRRTASRPPISHPEKWKIRYSLLGVIPIKMWM